MVSVCAIAFNPVASARKKETLSFLFPLILKEDGSSLQQSLQVTRRMTKATAKIFEDKRYSGYYQLPDILFRRRKYYPISDRY